MDAVFIEGQEPKGREGVGDGQCLPVLGHGGHLGVQLTAVVQHHALVSKRAANAHVRLDLSQLVLNRLQQQQQ